MLQFLYTVFPTQTIPIAILEVFNYIYQDFLKEYRKLFKIVNVFWVFSRMSFWLYLLLITLSKYYCFTFLQSLFLMNLRHWNVLAQIKNVFENILTLCQIVERCLDWKPFSTSYCLKVTLSFKNKLHLQDNDKKIK